jgi:hypothetical protein
LSFHAAPSSSLGGGTKPPDGLGYATSVLMLPAVGGALSGGCMRGWKLSLADVLALAPALAGNPLDTPGKALKSLLPMLPDVLALASCPLLSDRAEKEASEGSLARLGPLFCALLGEPCVVLFARVVDGLSLFMGCRSSIRETEDALSLVGMSSDLVNENWSAREVTLSQSHTRLKFES